MNEINKTSEIDSAKTVKDLLTTNGRHAFPFNYLSTGNKLIPATVTTTTNPSNVQCNNWSKLVEKYQNLKEPCVSKEAINNSHKVNISSNEKKMDSLKDVKLKSTVKFGKTNSNENKHIGSSNPTPSTSSNCNLKVFKYFNPHYNIQTNVSTNNISNQWRTEFVEASTPNTKLESITQHSILNRDPLHPQVKKGKYELLDKDVILCLSVAQSSDVTGKRLQPECAIIGKDNIIKDSNKDSTTRANASTKLKKKYSNKKDHRMLSDTWTMTTGLNSAYVVKSDLRFKNRERLIFRMLRNYPTFTLNDVEREIKCRFHSKNDKMKLLILEAVRHIIKNSNRFKRLSRITWTTVDDAGKQIHKKTAGQNQSISPLNPNSASTCNMPVAHSSVAASTINTNCSTSVTSVNSNNNDLFTNMLDLRLANPIQSVSTIVHKTKHKDEHSITSAKDLNKHKRPYTKECRLLKDDTWSMSAGLNSAYPLKSDLRFIKRESFLYSTFEKYSIFTLEDAAKKIRSNLKLKKERMSPLHKNAVKHILENSWKFKQVNAKNWCTIDGQSFDPNVRGHTTSGVNDNSALPKTDKMADMLSKHLDENDSFLVYSSPPAEYDSETVKKAANKCVKSIFHGYINTKSALKKVGQSQLLFQTPPVFLQNNLTMKNSVCLERTVSPKLTKDSSSSSDFNPQIIYSDGEVSDLDRSKDLLEESCHGDDNSIDKTGDPLALEEFSPNNTEYLKYLATGNESFSQRSRLDSNYNYFAVPIEDSEKDESFQLLVDGIPFHDDNSMIEDVDLELSSDSLENATKTKSEHLNDTGSYCDTVAINTPVINSLPIISKLENKETPHNSTYKEPRTSTSLGQSPESIKSFHKLGTDGCISDSTCNETQISQTLDQSHESMKINLESENSKINKPSPHVRYFYVNISKYKVPLSKGWKRILVYRTRNRPRHKGMKSGDVYYFSPEGKKFRSWPEILKHLSKLKENIFQKENFSFTPCLIGVGLPHEEVRNANPEHDTTRKNKKKVQLERESKLNTPCLENTDKFEAINSSGQEASCKDGKKSGTSPLLKFEELDLTDTDLDLSADVIDEVVKDDSGDYLCSIKGNQVNDESYSQVLSNENIRVEDEIKSECYNDEADKTLERESNEIKIEHLYDQAFMSDYVNKDQINYEAIRTETTTSNNNDFQSIVNPEISNVDRKPTVNFQTEFSEQENINFNLERTSDNLVSRPVENRRNTKIKILNKEEINNYDSSQMLHPVITDVRSIASPKMYKGKNKKDKICYKDVINDCDNPDILHPLITDVRSIVNSEMNELSNGKNTSDVYSIVSTNVVDLNDIESNCETNTDCSLIQNGIVPTALESNSFHNSSFKVSGFNDNEIVSSNDNPVMFVSNPILPIGQPNLKDAGQAFIRPILPKTKGIVMYDTKCQNGTGNVERARDSETFLRQPYFKLNTSQSEENFQYLQIIPPNLFDQTLENTNGCNVTKNSNSDVAFQEFNTDSTRNPLIPNLHISGPFINASSGFVVSSNTAICIPNALNVQNTNLQAIADNATASMLNESPTCSSIHNDGCLRTEQVVQISIPEPEVFANPLVTPKAGDIYYRDDKYHNLPIIIKQD